MGTLGSVRGALSNERPYRDHLVRRRLRFAPSSRVGTYVGTSAVAMTMAGGHVVTRDPEDYGCLPRASASCTCLMTRRSACCVERAPLSTWYSPIGYPHALGSYAPCTARLSNRVHSFYVEIDPSVEGKPTEPGIEHKLVSHTQLAELILAGEFALQLHIGAVLLAGLRGYIGLGALRSIQRGVSGS